MKRDEIVCCSVCGTVLASLESIEKKKCSMCRDDERKELYNRIERLQEEGKKPMLMDERVELLKEVLKSLDDVLKILE